MFVYETEFSLMIAVRKVSYALRTTLPLYLLDSWIQKTKGAAVGISLLSCLQTEIHIFEV